jgi:acetyl esterase/lipase
MPKYKLMIPSDNSRYPGMKTIYANKDETTVSYLRDVEYVRRGDTPLTLQILTPNRAFPGMKLPCETPLLLFVCGSAWHKQDTISPLPSLMPLAKAGYVVASVEYRASDDAKFPAFLQDVKSAVRYMRANADVYGIDPERVAIFGNSSGGHAALLTGLTADMPEFKTDDNAELSDAVQAVIDFYGPTDVTHINDAPRGAMFVNPNIPTPEDVLYGGVVAKNPEISQPGNPLNYISANKPIPPIFIAHGDSDALVPFNQSAILYEKLLAEKKTVEFYKVMGADHGIFFPMDELNALIVKFLRAYV